METASHGVLADGEAGLRTPKRHRRRPLGGGGSASAPGDYARGGNNSRRTLFSEDSGCQSSDSELSNISPLSRTSSEVCSPPMPLACWSASPRRSALKCISPLKNNFDQLLIGLRSPGERKTLVQHRRAAMKSPRNMMKGVSPLGPDRGIIEPVKFYGNKEETPLDGVQLLKKVRASLPLTSSARARLFLDEEPRDRKRARSGGATSFPPVCRPPLKKQKKNSPSPPKLLADSLAWRSALRKRKNAMSANAKAKKRRPQREIVTSYLEDFPSSSKTPTLKKRICNWEVFSFSRPKRVETELGSENRKFFRTVVPKNTTAAPSSDEADGVLTPPPTVKKPRKLLSHFDWLGDVEEESADKGELSKRKIVEEIRDDVFDMMADDDDKEVRTEVEELLKSWDDDLENENQEVIEGSCKKDMECQEAGEEAEKTPLAANQPSISFSDNKENQRSASNRVEAAKLFPIFSPGHNTSNYDAKKKKSPPSTSILGGPPSKKLKPTSSMIRDQKDLLQYQIDAGQSSLAETQCTTCGLFYAKGNPVDEMQHIAYHNNCNELKFNGWKKERLVGMHGENDRIVCIMKDDPKAWWLKAKTVLSIVDAELGFPPTSIDCANQPKIFLYVRDKQVVGCAVAEIRRRANRLLGPVSGVVPPGVDFCSEEEYPTRCGISRIWVDRYKRGLGIASRLMDAIRRNFCYGMILPITDLAFSVPTEEGKKFARAYIKRPDILVYM